VCVECARSACALESLTCPVCNTAVPLQERRYAVKMAEEMAQSMISLVGKDNVDADGAAPVGKGVGGSAASGCKRDRAQVAEKEREMEEDDLESDMDIINDMQQEIAHDTVFT